MGEIVNKGRFYVFNQICRLVGVLPGEEGCFLCPLLVGLCLLCAHCEQTICVLWCTLFDAPFKSLVSCLWL